MKIIKNKGFTLIELLVTIAVLSILVLLGAPKLTSYVQEAQLTRIQHDVNVMEQEMKLVLLEDERLEGFDYNAKDLGLLIEANRLFEKEGHAEGLEYVPVEGEINGLNKKERKISSKANSEVIGIGGVEYSIYDELGLGGNEIKIGEEKEFKEIYERYKIVPDSYKDKIKTRLKGTFYTNENGKVYYEPDKPNKIKTEPKVLNCDVALPDYEFEPASGKIVKWHGTEQHLIIPSHFLVDDECVPVRIIGEGAFMQGGFKSIMIPPSVLIIERNAFKESGVDSISIPGSVREIGQGTFDGIEEVVYLGGPSRVNNGSGPGTYLAPNGSIKNIVHRYPSAGEARVVFHPGSGTIVRGSKGAGEGSGVHIPEYIHVGGRDVRVRKVAKGAYQGLGLITVILPETLEIIEDYAFSGNQLIGVTIPNSVYHIGHYAFSFNEVWHEDNENDRKATIKTVIIKEEEQFEEIDKVGNIVKDGIKINLLEANSSELGPNVKLLNHIWVTSIGNIVIDVKYGPVSSEEPGFPTESEKEPVYYNEEIQGLINKGYIPIATAEELNSIRDTSTRTYGEGTDWADTYAGGLGNKYVQVANINLSNFDNWTPIGTYSSRFTGSFDGNGYSITGLTINRPTTDYVGLFGLTDRATISNVALEDINVNGKSYVGSLVGLAEYSTTISNSYSTGSVTGSGNWVGGLVGSVTVSTTISNSYATGEIRGNNAGGLLGFAGSSTTISNSYATGPVTGSGGGLVGSALSSSTIRYSYWDRETTGRSTSAGQSSLFSKTTDEMKLKETYSGWDFESVWKIDEGNNYPKLR